MSPGSTLLLVFLLASPTLVAPQISLSTIRNVLCMMARGVFRVNGCIRDEKILCRLINLKFRFFCRSHPCTGYSEPTGNACTNLLFQCPIFDVLPFGICPPLKICCGSDSSSFPSPAPSSIVEVTPSERSRESPILPRWLSLPKLTKVGSKPPLGNGQIWRLISKNVFKKPSTEKTPDNDAGTKGTSGALFSLGAKFTSNAGKMLTNTAVSAGKHMTTVSKLLTGIGGNVLSGAISTVGKTLASNKNSVNAGKAIFNTLSTVGKSIASNKAVTNVSKIILEAATTLGKKFKHFKFIKREKRSASYQYDTTYFNLVKDMVGVQSVELSSPDNLPIDIESYIQDWPSDESDMIIVETALEREYLRFMEEIDLINEEAAHYGGELIVKITFEEFKNEILDD